MIESIEFLIEDQIAILRVNRPGARNALNRTARARFAELITAVSRDPSLRALIITGAGDRAFAAGADLKELHNHPEAEAGAALSRGMSDALTAVTQLPIPAIAAVNGDALGGGCEIVTACDLRVAAPHARLGMVQIRNGLTSGWGGAARLAQEIGGSRAMEMMLTTRIINANEAKAIGLIHRIAPDPLEAAKAWAAELKALPKEALTAVKRLLHAAPTLTLAESNALETRLFTDLWPQPDHLEAMAAFVEKRKPEFNK